MTAGPLEYFIAHFVMDPKRETAVNLMGKLKSVHHRLRLSMGLAQDDNADVIAVDDVPTPPEPMWNLCTDSPNVMKAFRRQALLTGLFTFAYGCLPHGLHNLCIDVNKFPVVKRIMSINVLIVNKINAVHLLTSTFEVVCAEKHGKTYSLIQFTKTRWCTGYFMLRRNLLLKSVLVSMPNSIDHDDKFKDVVMEPELRSAILDVSFWKSTIALEKFEASRIASVRGITRDVLLEQFSYFQAMSIEGTHLHSARLLKPALIRAQCDDEELAVLVNVPSRSTATQLALSTESAITRRTIAFGASNAFASAVASANAR
ncbi:hypothetical protein DYB32_008406 [Aphanomyces invadans]|uniref:Uncharacterized protein n=1 Tax=Aphanomyces invadans TaxID=157072 RepID=A0A418AL47_9STRA|nr:hypothetical protein DYB32_008406 [Aphanomyces invadans]